MSKEKFHIEFPMKNAAQGSLWRMISQASGLAEWFADEVSEDSTETVFTFVWRKTSDQAVVVYRKPPSNIRFQWLHEKNEGVYFEFIIHKLDLTEKITLEIIDFAEPEEKADSIALWESQVVKMRKRLGILPELK